MRRFKNGGVHSALGHILLAAAFVCPSASADSAKANAAGAVPQGFSFAVVGDTHVTPENKSTAQAIVEAIRKEGVSLALFPGDIVEGGKGANGSRLLAELSAWKEVVAPLEEAGIGVYPLRGNHEADVRGGLAAWRRAFSGQDALPGNGPAGEEGLSYSFESGGCLFILMDNYVSPHLTNPDWLSGLLAARQPGCPVFVLGHEAAFRSFHPDCLGCFPAARDAFWAMLEKNDVDAYLCGHDHFADITRIDNGDGDPDDDILQCVVGTGGGRKAPGYGYNGDNSGYAPRPLFHEAGAIGYLVVTVGAEENGARAVTMRWKRVTTGLSGLDKE